MGVNGSRDDSDGRSLERIEQALLAEDPEFVGRLRDRAAALATAPGPPVDLGSLLVVAWCVAGAIVMLSLAAGSLVGAAGTCVLALVLHRSSRAAWPGGAVHHPPGRSAPSQR